MGYQIVKRYKRQDGSVAWRIIHETYSSDKRTQRHIPKDEWRVIGFRESMTFEEARERAKQLSAQDWVKFQGRRRDAIKERLAREEKIECAWLPPLLCQRFEDEVLKEKVCWGEETYHYRQLCIYRRTAKRIIREINIEPAEWSDRATLIYAFFKRKQWSLSYAQKVIRVLNLWGKFYGKSLNKYFEPVPKPSGEASVRIHESFFGKRPYGLTSAPITWASLSRAKADLDPKAWNWLYLTLWFGLRPSELNNLKWKVEEYQGKKLLAVFQHKLVRLPSEQRWKFIPILFPEQEKGLEIIESREFKSPSVATVQKHVNPRASLRGGRKGFVALMWEMGKYPKHVTYRWLGHKSVKTTDNHYVQGIQQACEFQQNEERGQETSVETMKRKAG